MEDWCEDTGYNGKNDMAIVELASSINFDKMNHVKPACDYAHQQTKRTANNDVSFIE